MKGLPVILMAASVGAIAAVEARADSATVLLGNEYGEAIYTRDGGLIGLRQSNVSAGLLMTESNDVLIHGTVAMPVLEQKTPLDISIGSRLFLTNLVEPDDDVIGIGFGAEASWLLPTHWIPLLRRFPLTVAASFYFSPEITTSGSGVDITDVHVIRGELELAPNVDALVGLRSLNVDRDTGSDDIVDEKIYVGLRARF